MKNLFRRTALLAGCGLLLIPGLSAMGTGEDPLEILTKEWTYDGVRTLEIRGEIDLELRPGPRAKLTVEASRALFDQLWVSNWWGSAAVAVNSGLTGPREIGKVKVVWELPSLEELTVADGSSGTVRWPGKEGRLKVWDRSGVTLEIEADQFRVEGVWHSSVTLGGRVGHLVLKLRRESGAEASRLEATTVEAFLDEGSSFRPGETQSGTASVRHGSRLTLPEGAAPSWTVGDAPP